jgi:hypothetical protein
MDAEAGFEIHAQGSLVILFGPRGLPCAFDWIGGGITLSDM